MLANPSSLDLLSVSGMDPATAQVETPSGNSLTIKCDSKKFGTGLNARSCFDALDQSPTGDIQESWGFPETLGPDQHVDVTLPTVSIGSKYPSGRKAILRLLNESDLTIIV